MTYIELTWRIWSLKKKTYNLVCVKLNNGHSDFSSAYTLPTHLNWIANLNVFNSLFIAM